MFLYILAFVLLVPLYKVFSFVRERGLGLFLRIVTATVMRMIFPSHAVPAILKNTKKNDPTSVIDAIDTYAEQNWMMNLGPVKGDALDPYVRKCQPKKMLELGTYYGYSAIRWCRTVPDVQLVSIDVNEATTGYAKTLATQAGVIDNIDFLLGGLEAQIPYLQTTYGTFDCVFLDHAKSLYTSDLKLLMAHDLISKGTLILADNVKLPGNPEYIKFMDGNTDFDSTFVKSVFEYSEVEDIVCISVYLGK